MPLRITVQCRYHGPHRVPAIAVKNGLCVTPKLIGGANAKKCRVSKRRWHVTQIATGYCVDGCGLRKREAMNLLGLLAPLADWPSLTVSRCSSATRMNARWVQPIRAAIRSVRGY